MKTASFGDPPNPLPQFGVQFNKETLQYEAWVFDNPLPGGDCKFWIDSDGNVYWWRVVNKRPQHMEIIYAVEKKGLPIQLVQAGEWSDQRDINGVEGSMGYPVLHTLDETDPNEIEQVRMAFPDLDYVVNYRNWMALNDTKTADWDDDLSFEDFEEDVANDFNFVIHPDGEIDYFGEDEFHDDYITSTSDIRGVAAQGDIFFMPSGKDPDSIMSFVLQPGHVSAIQEVISENPEMYISLDFPELEVNGDANQALQRLNGLAKAAQNLNNLPPTFDSRGLFDLQKYVNLRGEQINWDSFRQSSTSPDEDLQSLLEVLTEIGVARNADENAIGGMFIIDPQKLENLLQASNDERQGQSTPKTPEAVREASRGLRKDSEYEDDEEDGEEQKFSIADVDGVAIYTLAEGWEDHIDFVNRFGEDNIIALGQISFKQNWMMIDVAADCYYSAPQDLMSRVNEAFNGEWSGEVLFEGQNLQTLNVTENTDILHTSAFEASSYNSGINVTNPKGRDNEESYTGKLEDRSAHFKGSESDSKTNSENLGYTGDASKISLLHFIKFAERSDVEIKADQIFSQGGVEFVVATPDPERNAMLWEFNVTSTSGQQYPLYGDTAVDNPTKWIDWFDVACSCDWGRWNYDRAPEYRHLERFPCSHAMATEKWLNQNGQREQDRANREMETGQQEIRFDQDPEKGRRPRPGDVYRQQMGQPTMPPAPATPGQQGQPAAVPSQPALMGQPPAVPGQQPPAPQGMPPGAEAVPPPPPEPQAPVPIFRDQVLRPREPLENK